MLPPKRNARKKAQIKKVILFMLSVVILGSGMALVGKHFDIKERIMGVQLESPIPQLSSKSGFSFFSKSPKDEISTYLSKAGVSFEHIYEASQSAYIVSQKDGKEIYLTSQKDIKLQVATLQLILSRLTIEGKNFSRLDLRYDKPVIVLK